MYGNEKTFTVFAGEVEGVHPFSTHVGVESTLFQVRTLLLVTSGNVGDAFSDHIREGIEGLAVDGRGTFKNQDLASATVIRSF